MKSRDRFRSKWTVMLSLVILAVALPVVAQEAGPASGNGVQPVWVAGNPVCAQGPGAFSFKIEPVESGTYVFPDPDNANTINVVVENGASGPYFSWTSTLAIDSVIVKGGDNANVYAYLPESTGDTFLHAPVNPNNGAFFGLSHLDFCFDYEVTVGKTAETTFTRTYSWDIDKAVDPASWSMLAGESGASSYVVTATKTGYTDSGWAVSGLVTIMNDTPWDATLVSVGDVVSGIGPVALDCDGISFPATIAAGDILECSYAFPLPDGTTRVNTASVVTSGVVGGGEASAAVVFGDPTTEINASVTVTDTNGDSWEPVSDTTSWPYSMSFSCSTDTAAYTNGVYTYWHDNTATIVQTGQYDSARVDVSCYAPVVTKDASTTLDRTWTWTLDKVADQEDLLLALGQTFTVNYSVTAEAMPEDSDWTVNGTIWVHNPSPTAAMTVTLADVVDGVTATLDCVSPLTVAAGATTTCGYTASLPDGNSRLNVATATLNQASFSGTAAVSFDNAVVTEIDECVGLEDDPYGVLAEQVCYAQAPFTVSYAMEVGPFDECGFYDVVNTASFVTSDGQLTGADTVVIPVEVPCEDGCTLTPGYWKTHSTYGPAPYDATWALIGEDTLFHRSGQSYYEVLWTAPQGNAYYILAHAFIAAELNVLNLASMSVDVQDVMDAAHSIFAQYTPAEIAAMKGKSGTQVRAEILGYAVILDDYNNGFTGPGHCSE